MNKNKYFNATDHGDSKILTQ